MIRRPPRSTRTDTLFPYTTLFRSTGVIRNRKFAFAALACTALSSPAFAQDAAPADVARGEDAIVVTAARTILPPNALPLTIEVIDKDALDQQLAISGSVTDAVSTLTPSRSEERRVGKEGGSTCRSRWSPSP